MSSVEEPQVPMVFGGCVCDGESCDEPVCVTYLAGVVERVRVAQQVMVRGLSPVRGDDESRVVLRRRVAPGGPLQFVSRAAWQSVERSTTAGSSSGRGRGNLPRGGG